METLDATFSALADPTRRAIIARLAAGSATVNELAEPFEISLPAISRHIKVLEGAGLIRREVEAQKRRCHLQPETLKEAEDWIEKTRAFWGQRLNALDKYLDEKHIEKEKSDE
ncbi:MAG: metalloregulator ArsR/SmtB family transcription factor [Hyphomicrobiales bacterium]|nr:metalloregulator ArsR/SmtB family transcription factor [Hyphomicrobiales bacterium]